MDEKTLTALKASIEKWERNAVARTPQEAGVKSDTCALCTVFICPGNFCGGCPVSEKTGTSGCRKSPWVDAFYAWIDWRDGGTRDAFHTAAREEVAFLKSLLPASEQSS